jgi:hypothetical protein
VWVDTSHQSTVGNMAEQKRLVRGKQDWRKLRRLERDFERKHKWEEFASVGVSNGRLQAQPVTCVDCQEPLGFLASYQVLCPETQEKVAPLCEKCYEKRMRARVVEKSVDGISGG